MSDDSAFVRIHTARACVIETINPKTLTVRYYPGVHLADGRELFIDEPSQPKYRKSWQSAMNAAQMLLIRMQSRLPPAPASRPNGGEV